ncbi:MAG: cytochrome C [Gammaproteobacteria bacterium]
MLGILVAFALPGTTDRPLEKIGPVAADSESSRHSWQRWVLNCQGCHRADGAGSPGATPALRGNLAKFLAVPGGREYLVRVPGVASAPLRDAELAELLNWTLARFDPAHLPDEFHPFTAAEVRGLRRQPLRMEASTLRSRLLSGARSVTSNASGGGGGAL